MKASRFALPLLVLLAGLMLSSPAMAQAPASDPTATNDVFHSPQPFATAHCQDGWISYSQVRDGTCAGHGGVNIWIVQPGDLPGYVLQRQQERAAELNVAVAAAAAANAPAATPVAQSSTAPAGAGAQSVPLNQTCVSFSGGACVTLCNDGQWSSDAGQGTCVNHGGQAGAPADCGRTSGIALPRNLGASNNGSSSTVFDPNHPTC